MQTPEKLFLNLNIFNYGFCGISNQYNIYLFIYKNVFTIYLYECFYKTCVKWLDLASGEIEI